MSRAGQHILRGMEEAAAYVRGEPIEGRVTQVFLPGEVDVAKIRHRLGLSQREFARTFAFSVRDIRDWEQKRRTPEPSIRAYLKVIEQHPEAVRRALHG